MKKKIISLLLFIIIVISFTGTALVSAKVSYTKITATGTLNTIGDSTLTLSSNFSNDKVEGIALYKSGKAVSAEITLKGAVLTISPTKYLEGEAVYTVKINTHSSKRYSLAITAKDTFEYDTYDKAIVGKFGESRMFSTPSGDTIIEIAPKPSKGFNYPYLLLIPKGTVSNTGTKYMVVETNNLGRQSSDLKTLEEDAFKIAHAYGYSTGNVGGYHVASALQTPLLVPVFPRPITSSDGVEYYTHDLDRSTMLIQSGDLKRIDLQLKAMIEDAQKLLGNKGIVVENKVFMVGFSASAKFANKFTALHPELVKAAATGGVNAYTILPTSSWGKTTLNYPIGVADFEKITGTAFNETKYKQVAQFIFMGENDTNDILQNYSSDEQLAINSTAKKILGEKMMPDRWSNLQSIYSKLGYDNSIQFHTYKGIGHDVTDNVRDDLVAFFKANMGTVIKKIEPHTQG